MTKQTPPGTWASVPRSSCPECAADTPAGNFCGNCGAALSPEHGLAFEGPSWLRLRTYAAAPNQHVLFPSVVSSLFPRLPRRSRAAFAVGLIALLVLLAGCAALRWQGPLIGLCALALPLLFGIYLHETDAFTDLSVWVLSSVAVLEVVLGVGYSLFTGAIVAGTYDDVLGAPVTATEKVATILAIPIGEVFVMLGPVVLVRLLRPGRRESLDGFAIGASAALCFTAAGTFTRLAAQFKTGLVGDQRPIADFLVTATIQGVAIPATAAAVVGMVGATLWFRWRTDTHHKYYRYGFTAPAPALAVGVLAYIGIGWFDGKWLPQGIAAAVYALIAVLAVLVLRLFLHTTLLCDVPDDTDPDTAVLCPQCENIVPDLAFCPHCGVSARAASRSSRETRRAHRPVPETAPEGQ